MSRLDAKVPGDARRIARMLARELDVSGLYWGTRRRRGRWTDEPCISVEVPRKHPRRRLPAARLLPTRVDGVRIDVVEVGSVIAAALAHDAPVEATGRTSSITCLARVPGGKYRALMCGHGTLPIIGGDLQRTYDAQTGPPIEVTSMGSQGLLLLGRLSGRHDFAIAEFAAHGVVTHHDLGGEPLRARSEPLEPNEFVYHQDFTGQTHEGLVAIGLSGHSVRLQAGAAISFTRLFRIHPSDGVTSFGAHGDSGSLVFDAAGRAIGVLIAVGVHAPLTYVLPLTGLAHDFPEVYSTFFP